jgi:hypothetical protein
MGQTARLCAARIKRIGRTGFWPFVTKYFNGLVRLARGIRGAYYWEAIGDGRSLTVLVTMAKSTKIFRIINAASGEPITGIPGYRSFSAAHREAGYLNGKIPSPTNPLFSAPISVGVFSA